MNSAGDVLGTYCVPGADKSYVGVFNPQGAVFASTAEALPCLPYNSVADGFMPYGHLSPVQRQLARVARMGTDPIDPYKADVANYLEALGRNVRTLREAVSPRLSQERLADITGLHRTEIGKIEQGRVDPRLMTLHLVAHALNVTLDDLSEGLPVPPKRDPWGRYERGEGAANVDRGPQTDRRQSREARARGDI